VLALAALRLDAVLSVKVIHRIEPRTQAARWDDDVNVVRKFPLAMLLLDLYSETYRVGA
jgi:hypothetical protein